MNQPDSPTSYPEANPWYVLHVYHNERTVRDALREQGLNCFIPMKFREGVKAEPLDENISEKELTPVVHGYLFVEKTLPTDQMRAIFEGIDAPFRIAKHEDGRFYEVAADEMRDFRMLCDPTYKDSVFITAQQAEARIGKNVTIIRGRFRGIKGKLCQIKGKYYFIKHVAGLGVMIHITRWFCRVED